MVGGLRERTAPTSKLTQNGTTGIVTKTGFGPGHSMLSVKKIQVESCNSLCWYLSANLSGGYLFVLYGGPYGPKGEPPPGIYNGIYTGIYLPTFQEGTHFIIKTVSFVSGGPYGPRGVLSDFEGGPQSV